MNEPSALNEMRAGVNLFMRAMWGRAYVRVVGASRELSWFINEILIPILAMTAYVFIYRAFGAPKVYESLVIVGSAMVPFWLTVLWSMAAQFYWEKEVGNLDIFLISPMSPMALLGGMAIGGMFLSLTRVVAVILAGALLFHVPFDLTRPIAGVLVLLLTMTSLFSLGAMASSVFFLVGRAGMKINLILMEPVYLLSGFYFPVKNIGFLLSMAASAIPLTLGLDGLRQCILPNGPALGFLSVKIEIQILAIMTLAYTILAAKFFSYMESLGKREGRATLRWE